MKRIAIVVSLMIMSLSLAACGCSRTPTDPMVSSVPSLPDVISSVPMPPIIEDFFSSSIPPLMSSIVDEVRPTMGADFNEIGALPSQLVKWGPGTRRNAENRSEACVGLQDLYGKYSADFIMPNEQKIYLTFDQGFENGFTTKILDTLKEKNVQAVFFVTGHYAKTAPELVQRMIDEGHIIGNHSFGHPQFTNIPIEDAYADTKKLHDYMIENFDYTMNLFRYPAGEFSEQTLEMHRQMGYKSVFWSFAYADWDHQNQMGPAKALPKVIDGIHPGAVYLLHTVGKDNSEILGDFIDSARSAGYVIEQYK